MNHAVTKRSPPRDQRVFAPARLHSLLVPIDLTPSSDRVLGRIALLPLADHARVTLLDVVPGSLSPIERRIAERDANQALATEARQLHKSLPKHVVVDTAVKIGSAAKEIGICAIRAKAELVVMGRGGGRALRDAFLGSTAERVVRQARVPVLVVRLPPRTIYTRPALALDLDQAAHEVLRLMLLVLPPSRPRVRVIHALHVPYRYYPSLYEDEVDGMKDELKVKASRDLARLITRTLVEAKVPPEYAPSWETHVRRGSPPPLCQRG